MPKTERVKRRFSLNYIVKNQSAKAKTCESSWRGIILIQSVFDLTIAYLVNFYRQPNHKLWEIVFSSQFTEILRKIFYPHTIWDEVPLQLA